MSAQVDEQAILDDLGGQWWMSGDVANATIHDVITEDCQKHTTDYLVRSIEGASKKYNYSREKRKADILKSERFSDDHVPEAFEETTLTYVSDEKKRVTCSDCDGQGWQVCTCSRNGDCSRCNDTGTYGCHCTNGKKDRWSKGHVNYRIEEGEIGIASNTLFSENKHLFENAEGELIKEDSSSTINDDHDTEEEAEVEARLTGTPVRKRKRVYRVPCRYIQFEYAGHQYEAMCVDGDWSISDESQPHSDEVFSTAGRLYEKYRQQLALAHGLLIFGAKYGIPSLVFLWLFISFWRG